MRDGTVLLRHQGCEVSAVIQRSWLSSVMSDGGQTPGETDVLSGSQQARRAETHDQINNQPIAALFSACNELALCALCSFSVFSLHFVKGKETRDQKTFLKSV